MAPPERETQRPDGAGMPLFRPEALAHQSQSLQGHILLLHRPVVGVVVGAVAFCMVLAACFLVLYSVSRKEVVTGVLMPVGGLLRVYSPQAGLLLEQHVAEGQLVNADDVLFVLSNERRSEARGGTQEAVADTLKARLSRLRDEHAQQLLQVKAQHESLLMRRASVQGQIEHIGVEIELQRRRMTLAEQGLQRLSELHRTGFVSEAQINDKTAEWIDQQSRLRTLERNRTALGTDLTSVEADLQDLPLRARRESSGIERSMAEVEQVVAENEAVRRLIIRAPQRGRVTALAVEPGQMVPTSQPLLTLLPEDARLEAELFVPTRAIGFVKPGMPVLIRYQAFPYQKFGQHAGMVRDVSRSALATEDLPKLLARPPGTGEPLYRVRVQLDRQSVQAFGRTESLKAGMQLEASMVLEHRRLYEWALEPLLSITGKL